jgi:alpha-L-rhamnosidase
MQSGQIQPFIKSYNIMNIDTISPLLQESFIWHPFLDGTRQSWVVFRRVFSLEKIPEKSLLNVFADSRYMLWLNDRYIQRGPGRFDPEYPRYDIIDITPFLQTGENIISIIVHSYIGGANGRIMEHVPGLTACICLGDENYISTDETWRTSNNSMYLPVTPNWGTIPDQINTRNADMGWEKLDYDDSHWKEATRIPGTLWGKLQARDCPMQEEKNILFSSLDKNKSELNLPILLNGGECVSVDLGITCLAYPLITLEVEEKNSWINVKYGHYLEDKSKIIGRDAPDTFIISDLCKFSYMASDTQAFRYLTIAAHSGKVKITDLKIIQRSYPWQQCGDFSCSDVLLNKVWSASVQTVLCCSDDAYADDAVREKAEWLADALMCSHPVSQLVFSALEGETYLPDHRLFKQCLRRIAQSQSSDGRVKAHHPSDRFDIHAYINDYNFLWINGLKKYLDATDDIEFIQENWDTLVNILAYYSTKIDIDSLLIEKEFCYVCNPYVYQVGKGTTLNIGLISAFRDASAIASKIDQDSLAEEYSMFAKNISEALNEHLWNEAEGTYFSGIFDSEKTLPSPHAAIIALYFDVVPENRLKRVRQWILENYDNIPMWPYLYFYLFKVFYDMCCDNVDNLVLDIIREKWSSILELGEDIVSENFFPHKNNDAVVHQMGAAPALFLSTMLLGIRETYTIDGKRLLFSPRPGKLEFAKGKVLSSFGLIVVAWEKKSSSKEFIIELEAPHKQQITIQLPTWTKRYLVIINNNKLSKKQLHQAVTLEGLTQNIYGGKT